MFKKLILLICSFSFIFVLSEVACRLLFPFYSNQYVNKILIPRIFNSGVVFTNHDNYHPEYGYLLTPDTTLQIRSNDNVYSITTNSQGFRKSFDSKITLIGDSMFFGDGVENNETIAYHLKAKNLAISGYNTNQELVVAKNNPSETMILGFFIANDILPNAFSSANGKYNPETKALNEFKKNFEIPFILKSSLFKILYAPLYVAKKRYELSAKYLQKSLNAIKQFTLLSSNSVVVIIYPRDSYTFLKYWTKSPKVGQKIVSFCKQNNIEYIDLINYLNIDHFLKNDGHFTKEANRLIANLIFQKINLSSSNVLTQNRR